MTEIWYDLALRELSRADDTTERVKEAQASARDSRTEETPAGEAR